MEVGADSPALEAGPPSPEKPPATPPATIREEYFGAALGHTDCVRVCVGDRDCALANAGMLAATASISAAPWRADAAAGSAGTPPNAAVTCATASVAAMRAQKRREGMERWKPVAWERRAAAATGVMRVCANAMRSVDENRC